MTPHVQEIIDEIYDAWGWCRNNGLNPRERPITLSYETLKVLINEIEILSYRLEGLEK